MSPPTEAKGLSFVLLEPGPHVSEAEYHDWYDTEHAPTRLEIPTFYNAARFKAVDGQKPTYLTLYDLSEPSVADGPEYQAVRAKGSERDQRLLQTVQYLNRRAYTTIFNSTLPSASASDLPGKFVCYVQMEVTPEGEAELNKWYEEEHVPLLSKINGWVRSRRYTLHNDFTRASESGDLGIPVYKYLAVHDFSVGQYWETPEWKAAVSTPWREKVVKNVTGRELRHFELFREYKRPE
ncbi:hypothetical protein D9757_001420 [Collybiopsis confluens]|uniref:EthD domain-containing protein n=1 Tax=Collybiopsis confluens TaxID=2823264 RepID=A0A8H5HZ35_9AGAR|nr:hypothetical protein D9757_001420 [Collybiopsis confluens]